MAATEQDRETIRQLVVESMIASGFRRATFSGSTRSAMALPWQRVVVRPVEIRRERHLQFSYFEARKDVTRNYRPEEAAGPINALIDLQFAGIHLSTISEEIDVRTSKKGKVLLGRRPAPPRDEAAAEGLGEAHNRAKELSLPEDRPNRLLQVMGIQTSDGRIRPTMRAKFTQINEFLKHLVHVLDASPLRSLNRGVEILDCGCGSSYLTLAVHHYLNDVLHVPAQITGVDVNDDLIRKSTDRAQRLNMDRLAFACGRIRDVTVRPDIVLALHACDTATDDAIARAILADASVVLAVPCCHKNLNKVMRAADEAEPLRAMLRDGILRQRIADLATDAFRAAALRIMGYHTDVVEFVGTEHTARNLMIRAVRGGVVGDPSAVREYVELRRFWSVEPYIEKLLGERFSRLLS